MRPWLADPFLKETWTTFIWASDSIVQTIEHSQIFKKWLEEYIRRADTSAWLRTSIRSLRAAKHRFESSQKPAGRFVLFFEAVLKTSDRILKERRGGDEAGKRAALFFECITEEKLLQIAMMADAGDEAMMLTRGADSEKADAAIFPAEIEGFLDRVRQLFHHGKVFTTEGYTKFMLELLRKKSFAFTVNNQSIGIGGRDIAQPIKDRCLSRMKLWVKTAELVCAAEFPTYEVSSAYQVFNLKGRDEMRAVDSQLSDATLTSLQRLAKVYGVDASELQAQYANYLPRALTKQRHNGTNNMESWRLAVRHGTARKSVAANHPAASLTTVLKHYMASTISTSGVEQAWSTCCWVFGQGRGHACEHTEEIMIKLVVDFNPEEEDKATASSFSIYMRGSCISLIAVPPGLLTFRPLPLNCCIPPSLSLFLVVVSCYT